MVRVEWDYHFLAGSFLLGLPIRFRQLQTLSWQVQQALRGCSNTSCLLLQKALALNIYPAGVLTQEILLVAGLLLVGLVLFWRKSNHGPAIFFSVAMITYGPYITGSLDALLTLHSHWRLLIGLAQALGIGCAVLSGYLFPDGQFVPGWTRLLALLWISLTVIWLLVPGFPLTFADPYTVSFPSFLVLMGWLLSTLLAQAYRFWQASNPFQRRQTKWVLLCMTTTIMTYGFYYVLSVFFSPFPQTLSTPGLFYAFLGVPLFYLSLPISPLIIFRSMWRYHLFDMEMVINRVLVYGTLTIVLALLYAGSIFTVQYVFQNLAGSSQLALIGSTLGIAALFHPLRTRIQHEIDRRFYRRKYDATRILAAFGATLQTELDLDQLSQNLLQVVRETMQPTHVSLWLMTVHEKEPRLKMDRASDEGIRAKNRS